MKERIALDLSKLPLHGMGSASLTFWGTGAFMLLHTGTKIVRSSNGLLTTVAAKMGDTVTYALEGAAFIAGAAVQWLRDGLGLISRASICA